MFGRATIRLGIGTHSSMKLFDHLFSKYPREAVLLITDVGRGVRQLSSLRVGNPQVGVSASCPVAPSSRA